MSTVKTQWNMDTVKYGHDRTWALSNVYRIQDEYSEDTVEHGHIEGWTRSNMGSVERVQDTR